MLHVRRPWTTAEDYVTRVDNRLTKADVPEVGPRQLTLGDTPPLVMNYGTEVSMATLWKPLQGRWWTFVGFVFNLSKPLPNHLGVACMVGAQFFFKNNKSDFICWFTLAKGMDSSQLRGFC